MPDEMEYIRKTHFYYSDKSRLRITEYETRLIDEDGDVFDVHHFATLEEANFMAENYKDYDGAVGAVVERHQKFYPAYLFQTTDKYKTFALYGNVGTWADDDAIY